MSHVCRFCGEALKTTWGLIRHEDRHRGLSTYSCCEKQFSTKKDLTRHMCSVHGDTRQRVCPTCCAAFATKTDLTKHRRSEDSSVIFRFDVCGAELKERVNLQAHMHIHSNLKLQTCDKCGKSYRHRISLSKHKANKHAN